MIACDGIIKGGGETVRLSAMTAISRAPKHDPLYPMRSVIAKRTVGTLLKRLL